jgi:hypothetical protein
VKAKEKKQKMILAGLGAVLLIVLAIELPGMLSSGGSPSASPVATTTTAATSSGAPASAATAAPAGASVASSEVVFTASVKTLSTLGFFKAKDPFDSHGAAATPAGASTSPAAVGPTSPPPAAATEGAAAKAAAAAAAAAATSSGPIFGTIQGPTTQPRGSKPRAGSQSRGSSIPSAILRFNGQRLTVALGQSFPKKNPYFRLAGVKPDGVMIAVLKGSLADGSASLELVKNTPLTLVNTASGGRFRIELLSAARKT